METETNELNIAPLPPAETPIDEISDQLERVKISPVSIEAVKLVTEVVKLQKDEENKEKENAKSYDRDFGEILIRLHEECPLWPLVSRESKTSFLVQNKMKNGMMRHSNSSPCRAIFSAFFEKTSQVKGKMWRLFRHEDVDEFKKVNDDVTTNSLIVSGGHGQKIQFDPCSFIMDQFTMNICYEIASDRKLIFSGRDRSIIEGVRCTSPELTSDDEAAEFDGAIESLKQLIKELIDSGEITL